MKAKKGVIIAIFGSDGSGKSTAADLVQGIFEEHGWPTYHYHWRPKILPGSIPGSNSKRDITRPDTLKPRPWLHSMFMHMYYYIDFCLGYFFEFQPLLEKGKIIIYERYFYDILFHSRRYRLRQIKFLANILSFIIPKPDLIVLLHGNPVVIFARKSELSLDEIKRQQKKMTQYLAKLGNVLSIDVAHNGPQEVAHRICQEFLKNEKHSKKIVVDEPT